MITCLNDQFHAKRLSLRFTMSCFQLHVKYVSGTIPSTIFNISSLRVIDLTFNLIFGSLPKNMCDHLPKLEFFSIYSNHFSGEIPSELYKCRELQSLYLSNNTLTGVIPEEIGYLSGLKVLNLAGNMLSGLQSQVHSVFHFFFLYLLFHHIEVL
jgi:LRR receptor-like serine/threonine-protein kinase FLS2